MRYQKVNNLANLAKPFETSLTKISDGIFNANFVANFLPSPSVKYFNNRSTLNKDMDRSLMSFYNSNKLLINFIRNKAQIIRKGRT